MPASILMIKEENVCLSLLSSSLIVFLSQANLLPIISGHHFLLFSNARAAVPNDDLVADTPSQSSSTKARTNLKTKSMRNQFRGVSVETYVGAGDEIPETSEPNSCTPGSAESSKGGETATFGASMYVEVPS